MRGERFSCIRFIWSLQCFLCAARVYNAVKVYGSNITSCFCILSVRSCAWEEGGVCMLRKCIVISQLGMFSRIDNRKLQYVRRIALKEYRVNK